MYISRAKDCNVLMYRLLSNLPVKGKRKEILHLCIEILHFCKVVTYSSQCAAIMAQKIGGTLLAYFKYFSTVLSLENNIAAERQLRFEYQISLIEDALKDHGQLSRIEIADILLDIMPSILDDEQKKNKVYNLLKKLKKQGILDNTGKSPKSQWYLVK